MSSHFPTTVCYKEEQIETPKASVLETKEKSQFSKRLNGFENKMDRLIQSVERVQAGQNHSVEIGIQAFVGVEKDLPIPGNLSDLSSARSFDRATGVAETSQDLSSLKPNPVAKLGIYINRPLFRK